MLKDFQHIRHTYSKTVPYWVLKNSQYENHLVLHIICADVCITVVYIFRFKCCKMLLYSQVATCPMVFFLLTLYSFLVFWTIFVLLLQYFLTVTKLCRFKETVNSALLTFWCQELLPQNLSSKVKVPKHYPCHLPCDLWVAGIC